MMHWRIEEISHIRNTIHLRETNGVEAIVALSIDLAGQEVTRVDLGARDAPRVAPAWPRDVAYKSWEACLGVSTQIFDAVAWLPPTPAGRAPLAIVAHATLGETWIQVTGKGAWEIFGVVFGKGYAEATKQLSSREPPVGGT